MTSRKFDGHQDAEDGIGKLAMRIEEGDSKAEDKLIRLLRPVVIEDLRNRGYTDETEDIAHDALVIILTRLRGGSLTTPARAKYYLLSTARNIALGNFRKSARRKTICDTPLMDEQHAPESNIESKVFAEREGREFIRVMGKLTVDRDAYILKRLYLDDAESKDVCAELNLTSRHLSRCVYRARKRLLELVQA